MKFNESNEFEWVEASLSFRQFISVSCHSSSLRRQGFFSEWVQTGRAASALEKLRGLLHFKQNRLSSLIRPSVLPAKPSRPEAPGGISAALLSLHDNKIPAVTHDVEH